MLSLEMGSSLKPPKSEPFLVLHQLRTHVKTRPPNCSSAPLLKGTKGSGSHPAIIPLVRLPFERPSTPEAFIRFPKMWMTCSMKPPSLSAL